jgi:diguanylate cyclase (GGDEF)-like protein
MKNQIKREADFVARFGGEEFVCLLPFLEKKDALNKEKKLVRAVEGMNIPHPMSEHSKHITVSIGMANAIPDDHNSQTQLLDEADKALYLAKQSGRNMVVMG